jgi:5,10-methylenetetrahydrofolate reductase
MLEGQSGRSFQKMLAGSDFVYGVEVVSSRGLELPNAPKGAAPIARALLADPRVGWISITDNPGGGPMLPPDWLAAQLAEHREQIVIHATCKDANRSGLESAAWRYASYGFPNILALTGDYPTGGFAGPAIPVFDLDSVGLIRLLSAMNDGLTCRGRSGKIETLPKTDFFIGCAVSPFKRHERELMPQYFKLLRKIRAGAKWVVSQLGYDMRKFHEVKLFLAAAREAAPPTVGPQGASHGWCSPPSPRRVVLWQSDIRELQLASGAIRAGIELLLRRHGLTASDLDRVLVAGGFGWYIRRGNAQRMGLLPAEVAPERIHYVGNTSLAGARLVALSRGQRDEAEAVATATEHVDLSREPDFMDVYASSLIFPDTSEASSFVLPPGA